MHIDASATFFSSEFWAGDPFPLLARLRATTPIVRLEDPCCWVVTKYADVMAVARDPEHFSSCSGVLPADLEREVDPDESILYMDPRDHRRMRKLIQAAFNVKLLRDMDERIRGITRRLLDGIQADDAIDASQALSDPFARLMLAELLGVPTADRIRWNEWTDPQAESRDACSRALLRYFAVAIFERQEHPAGDLISQLLQTDVDGARLSEDDLLKLCRTLVGSGIEPMRDLLNGGLWALALHPDQREILVKSPALIPGGIEEMLRWISPIAGLLRTAVQDRMLRGKSMRQDDRILLLYASANRDEREFGADAAQFHVTRDPNLHMAFGFGEHYCLGATLTRRCARIFFEELLARFPNFGLAGQAVRKAVVLRRVIERLPLEFHEK